MGSENKSQDKKAEIKQSESKFDLENIKSDYFIQKIFDHFKRLKLLQIVQCNKKIQKRLNININDYKYYSEILTPIEIEIIPIKNGYAKFIHKKTEKDSFYHVFFDENEKEVKREYLSYDDKVTKIKLIIEHQVKSFEDLFRGCNIKSITFKKFYRNNITNMCGMFSECKSLKELNISKFNTSSVTNMSYMFFGCESLKKLDLSKFNTSNVTNMSFMFYECSSLKELISISNFDTTNVSNMHAMFSCCSEDLKMKVKSQNKNFSERAFM